MLDDEVEPAVNLVITAFFDEVANAIDNAIYVELVDPVVISKNVDIHQNGKPPPSSCEHFALVLGRQNAIDVGPELGSKLFTHFVALQWHGKGSETLRLL